MEIEINGVKYRLKEQPKRKPMGSTMASMLMLLAAYEFGSGSFGLYSDKPREAPKADVDIVKEYGLIQQKKSNLSRSQRAWVVRQFEKRFERIVPSTE